MKTLETIANEILRKLTFETHKSTTQIVVEGLMEAQKQVKLCDCKDFTIKGKVLVCKECGKEHKSISA
jgi:hypothetical protein